MTRRDSLFSQARMPESSQVIDLSYAGVQPSRSLRIPSLDGLRAVAIGFVMLSHTASNLPLGDRVLGHLGGLGSLGVRIFFVISGFLITRLLIQETVDYDRIDVLKFYFRRTLRIFPPFYFFVACMTAASVLGWVRIENGGLFHAVAYISNYHQGSWNLG